MSSSSRSTKSNGLQGDLLTGDWLSEAPRRGHGEHIKLTSMDSERAAVPGMADFSGGGPAGTYCQDCDHFGDEIAVQVGVNRMETTRAGCVIWARRMAHAAPSPRRDIRLCPSCKHFEKAAGASPRCFVIDMAGKDHRVASMPDNVPRWLRARS